MSRFAMCSGPNMCDCQNVTVYSVAKHKVFKCFGEPYIKNVLGTAPHPLAAGYSPCIYV